jgi:AcrR family transcriptional regulator
VSAPSARVNRGPAAASENRAAILAAARLLYADLGLGVPLSRIAKAADVSQGVLYRHFRTPLELALAVFETNFIQLEDLVAHPASTPGDLWRMLMDQTIRESAFVEMVVEARRAFPDYDGETRLRALVGTVLTRDREDDAGGVAAVDDVLLAWRMAFGIVVTSDSAEAARAALAHAGLLDPVEAGGALAPGGWSGRRR